MSERDEQGVIIWSSPEPFPAVRQKSRRGVRVTTAAAMALGLAVSGGAVAGATSTTTPSSASSTAGSWADRPPMGGSPPVAYGTVKSVGDGTFTLTTRDGTTVTVNVSSATTYRDGAVTSPTIANVTVGEHVAVFGADASNVVTATSVAIGGPRGDMTGRGGGPGGTPPVAFGAVKSVEDGTFTLTTRDGTTVTVKVSDATTYRDPAVTSPTIANVTVGEHVAVFGTDASNVVTATSVAIGGPGVGGPGGFPAGGLGGPPPAMHGSSSG
jgi:preprotein translocase subunit YajC